MSLPLGEDGPVIVQMTILSLLPEAAGTLQTQPRSHPKPGKLKPRTA